MFFSNNITIDARTIGISNKTYLIAEAGISHFGNIEKAFSLVDMAVEARADAVKFQMFDVDDLISNDCAEWKERLGSRQLAKEDFIKLQSYCRKKQITFLCTAHDEPSLDFLAETMDIPAFKIGSGEVANLPFIERTASYGRPVILSTGMYSQKNIEQVISIFKKVGNKDLILLHCVTAYPTEPENVNLNAICKMRNKFECLVGYSDHTSGFHIPLAAAAIGACVIEKHITLEYNIPNAQDWKVSCGPENLAEFVRQLRSVETALGNGELGVTKQEQESLLWARKSLVAARDIAKGEILTEEMIKYKRPGTGIAPELVHNYLGKVIAVNINSDSLFKEEHFQ